MKVSLRMTSRPAVGLLIRFVTAKLDISYYPSIPSDWRNGMAVGVVPRLLPCTGICIKDHAVDKSSFFDQFVEQPLSSNELRWSIEFGNLTTIEDHDAIGIKDSIDAMRNGDDGSLLEDITTQCRLKHGIRLDIHSSLTVAWPPLVGPERCLIQC